MKECRKCATTKPLNQFHKSKAKKDGRTTVCKKCRIKIHRQHYLKNKERYIANKQERKRKLREWYKELKNQLKCTCGEAHFACLVFHHNDASEKEIEVSNAIREGWGKKRVLKEIEKCTVLCLNCHRKLHWEENLGRAQGKRIGLQTRSSAGFDTSATCHFRLQ